jgi:uncharacterized protein YehS (DUF1456 family)
MTNNSILQNLQSILSADEKIMLEIFGLGNFDLNPTTLSGYLKEQGDKEYLDCGSNALGHFLDGLIVYKRGPSDKKSTDEEQRLNNNQILKKIRIAYELKEVDLYEIFATVEIDITKSELNSLFRKEDHKNFRACPDSILQLFLEGLKICEDELE